MLAPCTFVDAHCATTQAYAGPKDVQNAVHPQKPGPGLGPKDVQNAPPKPGPGLGPKDVQNAPPKPGPKPGPTFGGKHHGQGGPWGGVTAGLVGGAVLGVIAAQAYAPAECILETRAVQDGYGTLLYRQVRVCEE